MPGQSGNRRYGDWASCPLGAPCANLARVMKQPAKRFALCIENAGYEASLILGKVYPILQDAKAARDDLVRIVDESGED